MQSERKQQRVEFDPQTDTYRSAYTYPSEPPSIAVPLALTEVTDNRVTDLEPIHDATDVDPDALDEVFRPTAGGVRREGRVTFTYHGYTVAVESQGRIILREPDSG